MSPGQERAEIGTVSLPSETGVQEELHETMEILPATDKLCHFLDYEDQVISATEPRPPPQQLAEDDLQKLIP
ncbi:hypothetical protein PHISCL_07283 [Aspergillus sclerotialis]|uniref:Uncharacterized protein n=1 Tax=Aspergillus sclerotialis TaxID=2070753 RepID=A0A3A2ZG94_9EURO|nr:hypothetical protein PHISCL_07283 [Aspergillus sclerotialis]